jgi:hypothetical protein
MKAELQQKLIEKYPILFQDKNKSPKETLICFGIETGDGWYKILDDLFGYFYRTMDNEYYVPFKEEYVVEGDVETYGTYIKAPKIKLLQVKSKYATLRVYTSVYDDESPSEELQKKLQENAYERTLKSIHRKYDFAVDYAEYLSSKACEVCGEEGTQTNGYWVKTLCPEHMLKK